MILKELKNTVVNTKTQAEYDELICILKKAGRETKDEWSQFEEETCVEVEDEFDYCDKDFYENSVFDYKIITLNQFKQMQKKTLENLEVGDLIVSKDYKYQRILAKGQENGELTAYLTSVYDKNKNHTDLKKASSWYTLFELKDHKYKPVTEETNQVEVECEGKKTIISRESAKKLNLIK